MSSARLRALVWREALETWRDPFRLTISFATPLILMCVLGFGLSIDIERLPFAALDLDRTPASRAYLLRFVRSRVFESRGAVLAPDAAERALRTGEIAFVLEIAPGFQRELESGGRPDVAVRIDGAVPFEAATARSYVEAVHAAFLRDRAASHGASPAPAGERVVTTRFWYNPALESEVAFVPGLVAALLAIVPAMLTAVAVVREKELGSIANLYATPVTRLEFLLGKQIPYVGVSLVAFAALCLVATLVFRIPFRGSPALLGLGALLNVLATTGIGLLVSCFTRTQIAALMISVIVTLLPAFLYSGFFIPVSSLTGVARAVALAFPTTYFLEICVGTFSKGLGIAELWRPCAALAVTSAVLTGASVVLLRGQER